MEGGEAGLAAFEKDGADLIILDVKMKEMDGMDGLAEIRKQRDRIELPIIMATASHDEKDVVKAFELGANDYARQPVKFPILLARRQTQLQLKKGHG